MIADLKVGISGRDNENLFKEVKALFFADREPTYASADDAPVSVSPGELLPKFNNDLFLQFKDYGYLALKRRLIVLFGLNRYAIVPKTILSGLENLSFEVASFGALYPEWLNPVTPYAAPSFADFHLPLGWACAFKGAGFTRLVSRRWLDFGPWKQHLGSNDTQLIQFHSLVADPKVALEQARPGHHLTGISDDGGYIQSHYVYEYDNPGLYDPAERLLKVIVHGRDIPNRQLLDACAARLYQPLGPDKPLSNVAYVFMEDEKASEHLHQIWLRGLECRSIQRGREVRRDVSYAPASSKPSWVLNEP